MNNDVFNFDRALKPEEAAKILQLETKTLANLRSKGDGPSFIKMGRLIRYRYRDLMKYLDQNTVRTNEI